MEIEELNSRDTTGSLWKGSGCPGSGKGNWYNQKTGESLHPDFNHPGGMKPHWDYQIRGNDIEYRLFLDGTWEAK